MKSGLTSLLNAIFGKNDLDSVSLGEIHELINEFPSFNAAHFLLSKKLQQLNDIAYEEETMRTALYFNNAFWLQSVLEEDNSFRKEVIPSSFQEEKPEYIAFKEKITLKPNGVISEAFEEEISAYPVYTPAEFQQTENVAGPVSSFDELMSKYKIEPLEPVNESHSGFNIETVHESAGDKPAEPVEESYADSAFGPAETIQEFMPDANVEPFEIREEILNEYGIFEEVVVQKSDYDLETFYTPVEENTTPPENVPVDIPPVENEHIAVNQMQEESAEKPPEQDYEAFDQPVEENTTPPENVPVDIPPVENENIAVNQMQEESAEKPPEQDYEAFDQPVEENITVPGNVPVDIPPVENENIAENQMQEESAEKPPEQDYEAFDQPVEENTTPPENVPVDIPPVENEHIVLNQMQEESAEKPLEQDYEAFDRPAENNAEEAQPSAPESGQEISSEYTIHDADDTDNTEPASGEQGEGMTYQMQELANRFGERQKSVFPFDAKKAESIVFAPYHMIDYFASQGIKLVQEDHPADHFGKQLKSFTEWLKVMKRLPSQQPVTEKTEEKETERIRHFAAHSIEERDILTESMAEVLAKQGMYENAIALYQKLSLIYPPKSAYFASRIEQLKASLP